MNFKISHTTYIFVNRFDKEVRLSLGWKSHNLRFYLIAQLDKTRLSLGIFSEQTSEAAHKSTKPSLNEYLPNEYKNIHSDRLLKAVSSYSSMRM